MLRCLRTIDVDMELEKATECMQLDRDAQGLATTRALIMTTFVRPPASLE